MKIVILIVSFILESVMSNFFPVNSFFASLFSLMALIVIYPLFDGDNFKYFRYAFLLGFAYDLIYTDTIIFQAFLFLIIAYLVTILRKMLSDNLLNLIIVTLICIASYRTINYFALVITGNLDFNLLTWIASIYNSIILNVIYCLIIGWVVNRVMRKKRRYRF